jgi:hypothetical protein
VPTAKDRDRHGEGRHAASERPHEEQDGETAHRPRDGEPIGDAPRPREMERQRTPADEAERDQPEERA